MVTWHYCYNIHYLAQAHIKIFTKKHKTSHLEAEETSFKNSSENIRILEKCTGY